MPTAQYGVTLNVGGVSFNKTVVRTGDHPNPYEVSLPAGNALSSWVKTDADTAAGNLAGGHGLTNGTYDVYWTGGRRYGVSVTITTNAVALDGGSGTDFPATADTTVSMTKQVTVNTHIDGDAIVILGAVLEMTDPSATNKGQVSFYDSGDSLIAHLDLSANDPGATIYDIYGGTTNIFTGNPITYAKASNGSTTAAGTLKIASLEDSTP